VLRKIFGYTRNEGKGDERIHNEELKISDPYLILLGLLSE
jgi:hypothetical protein